MLQASCFNSLSFDPFSLQQNGLAASEIDVGGGKIARALVVAPKTAGGDGGFNLGLDAAWQLVVFWRDRVLEDLVPALDLAPDSGMMTARFGCRILAQCTRSARYV